MMRTRINRAERRAVCVVQQTLVGGSLLLATVNCGGDGGQSSEPIAGSGGSGGSMGGASSAGGTESGASGGSSGDGSGGTSDTSVGGSGGAGGMADTSSGGSSGSGGAGGSSSGGSGGSAGSSSGGNAGSGGTAPVSFAAITKLKDIVIESVNELRGLDYSANGGLWASGFTDADAENRQLAVVRFTPEGELDSSFAEDGILVFDVAPGDEQSRGIVELGNGDVIVQVNIDDQHGGEPIVDSDAAVEDQPRPHGRDVVLLRFDASGALVPGFGDAGMLKIDFGWSDEDNAAWPVPTYSSVEEAFSGPGFPIDDSWGIALDTSSGPEKIVVFGHGPAAYEPAADQQRYDNDRYVVRVLAGDGSIDPEFNGGKVFSLTSPGEFGDGARRGLVEPDGSILSAGYTNFGPGFGNHVLLVRLLPSGTLDSDFGFGISLPGTARFNPFIDDGGMAECYALGVQSNGRIVTTGYGYATATDSTSKYGYATSQLQDLVSFGVWPHGLDLDWGIQGTLAIQSEEAGLGDAQDRGRDLVVLSDDRVVHAGLFGPYPTLFVTTPDGELDTSVGEGGKFFYEPFPDPSHFYVIASNETKSRVAAATSNHADGVMLTMLEVAQD